MANNKALAGLQAVQASLKVGKSRYNKFGNYYFRSISDILLAARPLCNENGLVLTMYDDIELIGNDHWVKATARVADIVSGDFVEAWAYAKHTAEQKGMQPAQLTGSTSTYARKYALCGLFAMDDEDESKDPDSALHNRKGTETSAIGDMSKVRQLVLGRVNELSIPTDKMKIIIARFGKGKTFNDLAINELEDLLTNIQTYYDELK